VLTKGIDFSPEQTKGEFIFLFKKEKTMHKILPCMVSESKLSENA